MVFLPYFSITNISIEYVRIVEIGIASPTKLIRLSCLCYSCNMSFRKRVDRNQPEIVEALREAGASVGHTHAVGQGFPDVVVGVQGLTLVGNFSVKRVKQLLHAVHGLKVIDGANLLFELKDGTQTASKQKLTPDEVEFHNKWKGQLSIINSTEAAVRLVKGEDEPTNA